MKLFTLKNSVLLFLSFLLIACGAKANSIEETASVTQPTEKFQVVISGGHDTDPQDHGRPVILIASMLGVPSEVFREAFSHVHPAGAGTQPSESQAQANKAALMSVLEPYGVTNDWLDEVSNYYRYNQSAGEVWTQTPAEVEAIVENGVVTGFKIINPGSGYTSAPTITVSGTNVSATATLVFTTDFSTNGSIASITLNP